MREPRGQFAKIADTITGSMRRRQRDRAPRVIVYGADLRPRTIQPGDGHAAIVEVAEKLAVLGAGREETAPPEDVE